MKEHAFRLQKGQDLKIELEKYVKENEIKAGVIVTCVGCLYEAVIRNAGGKECIKLDKKLEIVSITGTLSINGSHIHIAVSDEKLNTYGGHLKEGCLVNTTAEVVIFELEDYLFSREIDETTGYKELVVKNK